MKNNIKCFIASAFGKDDVDAVYDQCVRPILKKLSVQALRVDRVEHNEDIDDKIFELLNKADLIIADLTYARPSVYYEAGYAFGRGKPVVYIARNDHFQARENDPEGLFRVHFDLQMKNIISWSKADDAFSEQLRKRLNHVLRPLLQSRNEDQKRHDERSQFGQLPQVRQIQLLKTKAESLLDASGFSFQRPDRHNERLYGWGVLASRGAKARWQDVALLCTPSPVKRFFEGIEWRTSVGQGLSRPLGGQFHYIIVSLNPVPRSRVTGGLPSFSSPDDGALYRKYESEDGTKAFDVFVHVIGGVKSESEFTDAFQSILARYDLAQSE